MACWVLTCNFQARRFWCHISPYLWNVKAHQTSMESPRCIQSCSNEVFSKTKSLTCLIFTSFLSILFWWPFIWVTQVWLCWCVFHIGWAMKCWTLAVQFSPGLVGRDSSHTHCNIPRADSKWQRVYRNTDRYIVELSCVLINTWQKGRTQFFVKLLAES